MSFFDLFKRLRRSSSDICRADSPQKTQKNGANEQSRGSDYPHDSGGLAMSAIRVSGRHKSCNTLAAFGPSGLNDSMMTMAATSTSGANQMMNNSRSAMSVGYFGDLKRSRSSLSATYNSNSLNNSKATSNTNSDAICDPPNDDLMIFSNKHQEYEVNIGSVEIWDKRLASKLLSQQSFLDLAGGQGLCDHLKKRFEAVTFKKLVSLLNHDYSIMCCDNLSIIYETEREAYYSSLEGGKKYVPKNFVPDSKSLLVCFECAKVLCQGIRTPNHFNSHTSLIKHHYFIDCLFKKIFCTKCGWLDISLCSGSYANFFDLFFNLFRDYLFPERKMSSISLLDSLQTSLSGSLHNRSFKNTTSNHSASQLSTTATTTATSLPRRLTNTGLWRVEKSRFSIAVEFTFPPKPRLKNLNAICSGTSAAAGATHPLLAYQRSCTENLINNSHKFYDEAANAENNGQAPEDGDEGELKSVIGLIRYKSSSESEYRNIMLPVIQSLIRMPSFNQSLIELWKSGIFCKVIFKPERSRSSSRYQISALWEGELDILINLTNDATIRSYLNIISNYSNCNPEKVKKNINHIWSTVSDSLGSQSDYDSNIGFAGQIARPGLLLNAIFQLLRSKILKQLFKILSLATSRDFFDCEDSYDIDSSPHWPLDQIFTLPNNFLRQMKSDSSPDFVANHTIPKPAGEETSDNPVNDYIVRVNRCVMPKACDSCLAKVNCDAHLADEESQLLPAYDNNLVLLSKSQDYLMPGPSLSVSKDNILHLKNPDQNMDEPEFQKRATNGRVMSKRWQCYSLATLVRNILIATSGHQQQKIIGEDEERSKNNNSSMSSEPHNNDLKWIYMILDVDGCLQDSPHRFNLQHSFEIALDIAEPSGYANPNRNNCGQLHNSIRSGRKPIANCMPDVEIKKSQPSLRMRVSSVIYRDDYQRWNCAIYTRDLQQVVVTCGKRVKKYPIAEFTEQQKMPSECISVIVLRRE